MIRLFYISTAAKGLTRKDHEDILRVARNRNRELGITGLLLVKGKYFAQALEGTEETVFPLLEKIKNDPRHCGVVCLAKSVVDERIFPTWQMGYRDLDDEGLSPALQHIDLGSPRFVKAPEELSLVFRQFIEEASGGPETKKGEAN